MNEKLHETVFKIQERRIQKKCIFADFFLTNKKFKFYGNKNQITKTR